MIRRATMEDIPHVAALHALILPDSIFVRLGRHFLEGHYHRMLARVEHVFSYVYIHDGMIAGFVAMTTSHRKFYAGIWKQMLPLSWALARSIAASPRVIGEVGRALVFLFQKDGLIPDAGEGELLQITVRPDFRAKGSDGRPTPFYARAKTAIARDLFSKAMEELSARKIKDFRIMTGDGNAASNRFYVKIGCRKVAGGIRVLGSPTSVYAGNVEEIIGILHRTGV